MRNWQKIYCCDSYVGIYDRQPIPTRAEVTDVANAVYEEADAIMLSGETTVGEFPVKCVETLDKIARSTESSRGLRFTDQLIINESKQK